MSRRKIHKKRENLTEVVESDSVLMECESFEDSEDDDDECKRRKKRQKARELIKQNKLKDAIALLETLPQTQSKQLLLAECYLQVGRVPQAIHCVDELKTMMTSEPRPRVDDVMQLIRRCIISSHLLRAMSLLYCASRLYKLDSKPDDAVVGIRNCTSNIDDVIRPMTKESDNARTVELGIKFMEEMLRDLRSVTDSTPGVKADMEARCLCDLGLSNRAFSKPLKAIDYFKHGLKVMKKQFGLNALKFQIYGHLSNNLAIVYKIQGQYGRAESLYKQSLSAYENALDWENQVLKERTIKSTRTNLSIVKTKME